ncbi:hypothetical protein DOFOFD_02030 [Acetobacteraceae bacterium EV16P]|uniref:Uncharacterized protein n=1 Tax=Sorlinia euscelidii TaxID=3081148 RepID=A0ABU7U1Q9_9PROT
MLYGGEFQRIDFKNRQAGLSQYRLQRFMITPEKGISQTIGEAPTLLGGMKRPPYGRIMNIDTTGNTENFHDLTRRYCVTGMAGRKPWNPPIASMREIDMRLSCPPHW